MSVRIKADPLVKDEIVYWDVKEFYILTGTVKLFQVNFENLFNGDKELGKRISADMNDEKIIMRINSA